MKKCIKCEKEKDLILFTKHKACKDGYNTICKSCKLEYNRIYREKNKLKIAEYQKKYLSDNSEKIKKQRKQYRIENSHILNKKSKDKYEKNKDRNQKRQIEYYHKNKEKLLKSKKEYYNKNKEYISIYKKEWAEKNKERISLKRQNYYKIKLKNDHIFKLKHNTRSLIKASFKRAVNGIYKKTQKTEKILGCTIPFFIEYIESKFKEGMNFGNHGKWHLDHIIPISSASNEEEIIKLNHYTNFQPLWAAENIKKGNKIITTQLKLI